MTRLDQRVHFAGVELQLYRCGVRKGNGKPCNSTVGAVVLADDGRHWYRRHAPFEDSLLRGGDVALFDDYGLDGTWAPPRTTNPVCAFHGELVGPSLDQLAGIVGRAKMIHLYPRTTAQQAL